MMANVSRKSVVLLSLRPTMVEVATWNTICLQTRGSPLPYLLVGSSVGTTQPAT